MDGAAQRTRRTRAAGVGLSLALHVVVLSWLGLRAVQPLHTPPPEDPPPLTIELVRPTPKAPVQAAAPRSRLAPPAPVEPVVLARPRPAAPVPRQLAPKPLPLPPVPSRGAAGGASGGGGAAGGAAGDRAAPGPLPGTELRSDLKGFLRGTVGCSHEEYLRLTPVERARCDSGFATAFRTAPRIPLPDDKLAGFARQADANERKRARREGSLENTLPPCPPDMVGSNLGFSCLPPQAHTSVGKF